ncbi:MAG: hypothetical protein Q8O99_00875 [bacterium]|nr:hypothetical protein [bacterium]
MTVRSGEIYEKIIHNTYTSIVPAMISKESEGTVTEQDMQVLDELFQDFFKKYPNGTINDFEIRLPQELEKDGKKKYYLF